MGRLEGYGFERTYFCHFHIAGFALVINFYGAGTFNSKDTAVDVAPHGAGTNHAAVHVGGGDVVGLYFTCAEVVDWKVAACAVGNDFAVACAYRQKQLWGA